MGGNGTYSKTRQRAAGGRPISTGGGWGKPDPLDLSQFDGMTLQELEDSSRGLPRERGFILDANGNLIRAYQGGRGSVAINGSDLFISGATFTHNHPRGSEGYGATFSLADVRIMASSDWGEMRATASGRNEYNYIIRREQNADGRALLTRLRRDSPGLRRQLQTAAANADPNLDTTSRRQIYTGILDRYYKETLPQYGFSYTTRKTTYRYNR